MKTHRSVAGVLGAVALVLSGCASVPERVGLPVAVHTVMADKGLPVDSLAVVAYPLDDRSRGLRVQAGRLMSPGSTLKLVTAVVALETLGPNARAATELRVLHPPNDQGVLATPLYVRGLGSADLGYGELHQLLRELREQGVRVLQGGVVLDRSAFRPERFDLGLAPFDEAPEFPYNVIPDALQLAGSLQRLELSSEGSEGLRARLSPALPGIAVDVAQITLVARNCSDWEDGWRLPEVVPGAGESVTVRLKGAFPRDCKVSQLLQLVDRQVLWEKALRQFWKELGGEWPDDAPVQQGVTPQESTVLARHVERPLAEVVRGLMKRSDNAQTRLLYLRLGSARAQGDESTQAAAARAVQDWFERRGLNAQGLVLDNGSGLSRSERVSVTQLADLLQAVWTEQRHLPELLTSLPVAGEDGTMGRRLKGSAAQGRARLKTGTLRDAVGLAGYVWDQRGRPWVMAALVNHDSPNLPERGRAVLDAVAEWIARQP
ncbi:D-alanyl-D-alanine carboxypeptidase/D-alanyl-D-alanine endopeptidase [Inhella gelatinilytica]|uniref:D-alanyl-D-alanine carboxypeptidase/D-alanyl-D-alanine-endopeptidase n=1 Tax=Inhella gelatinilytica TaxID=2795030 RepID=A0A931NEL3_9BURK|nr:D-alanyl-D-alanine carboxypeptidase/D-alanyl-D-alanine-endopeptidase [Inhella gelatinilytica]MBH9552636.1 D-alanyl-D-alanine carboxypeptidase/D-alanyl-D-alanine-endopeptidase [Inhella gelatinilytica]